MPIFRHKPTEIAAWQFDGTMISAKALADGRDSLSILSNENGEAFIIIESVDGRLMVSPGDWIIRSGRGEFYPCKPDIFAATYDRQQLHQVDRCSVHSWSCGE